MRCFCFGMAAVCAVFVFCSGCAWDFFKKTSQSETLQFQNTNLFGSDFGLRPKEIVLTFDDGPGVHTQKLAEFLRKEQVPAVFFMTANAASARMSVVKAVSEMRLPDGSYAHTIANHTVTHPKLVAANTMAEIKKANSVLEGFVRGTFFFRPPYGYFQQNKPSDRFAREDPTDKNPLVDSLNATDLKKYVGPVYWDAGGHLLGNYAADWACWSLPEVQKILPKRTTSLTPAECGARYQREVEDLGRGIVLAHDIHAKTVEMIMGSEAFLGKPGTPSLVKNLKAKGFRFVRLDAHPEALAQWTKVRPPESFPGEVQFSYDSHENSEGYVVSFRAASEGASRIEMRLDEVKGVGSTKMDGVVYEEDVDESKDYAMTYKRNFSAPGLRFVTFSAYKNGNLYARKTFLFKID
jgi:peptidoglycan/xylan/chitin deacetylase (PgdA/CDA1 family)